MNEMKASEVLKRYAAGERNFQRVNLRGQSFKGQNLSGADFSEADIRGTNFTGSNLRGTKFISVMSGLPRRWLNVPLILAFFILVLSTFVFSFAFNLTQLLLFSGDLGNIILSLVSLVLTAAYFFLVINQDFKSVVGVTITVLVFIFVFIVTIAVISENAGVFAFLLPLSAVVTILVIMTASIAVIVADIVAGAVTYALSFVFSIVGVVIGIFAEQSLFSDALRGDIYNIFFYIVRTIILFFLIAYISLKVKSVGKKKYSPLWGIVISFTTISSTSFREADLTDADFTKAILQSADFTKASLTRTYWHQAKKLENVCPGTTYLQNSQIRQLVATGDGKDQNFDRQDLRGVNLSGAKLNNASFIDTDFHQANLQEANLSRTILVRANFERADLRNVNLTGSCIQDWVITESTKLDGVICDYVYLKWDNRDKRDQMPPRGKFKAGGFVTFVRYILETVELYHEKDINPRLALTVLQKMSRDYDEPLDIVALGKKGERVFIQVKVSENITRENFKEDYYSRYDTDLKLWSGNIHQLPSVMDSFIEKRISEIASERTDEFVFVDAIYTEGNFTEIYQGEVNVTGDRNIKINKGNYNENIQGDYYEQSGNFGIGHMSGGEIKEGAKVVGVINEAEKQNLADAATEIQELLEQLSKTNSTTTYKEKTAVVGEVVDRIESNPTLKTKVINALKAGGTEAFKEAIDHPLVNILVATIEGWQDAE